tara:strand:+ start:523 stop:1437 length:915 start_codon:yes stop_codon:yes gene_type:complete
MNFTNHLHVPVLSSEFENLLNVRPGGVYIDATFGRGGHSKIVLSKLSSTGRLLVFDRDVCAISCAKNLANNDSRIEIFHSEFSEIPSILPTSRKEIDGIFFDLGVSSPQLENSSRGFSFKCDGPLDMRMNQEKGRTAEDWINSAPEKEIADVLWRFGEERFSRKIAKKIVYYRKDKAIKTTGVLADIIRSSIKGSYKIDPATRSFQAIRMLINEELLELESILASVLCMLKKGGRLLVISFHSIEDRLVKHHFRDLSKVDTSLPGNGSPDYRLLTKKPIRATREEIQANRRSRSARLRGLECLV